MVETKKNKPKVCIFGPGVVGYATGKVFAEVGLDVGFVGRSKKKIDDLKSQGYRAHTFEEINPENFDYDISFLTISTPSVNGKIDLSGIEAVSVFIGKLLKKINHYHVVAVKSTVVPGTTETLVKELLEIHSGKKAGRDFGLVMAPEYLREDTALDDSRKPWIVVIGEYDKQSGDMVERAFSSFDCPIYRCTTREAEMQKYVHNLFNAVKITFFNEMRQIGKKIGADAETIFQMTKLSCEGIWNPGYGLRNFGPYSGSCLPKDTQAFYHWAKKHKLDVDLLESTIEVNDRILSQNGTKKDYIIGNTL